MISERQLIKWRKLALLGRTQFSTHEDELSRIILLLTQELLDRNLFKKAWAEEQLKKQKEAK